MEKHLEYRSKVLAWLDQGLVFLLLLFRVIHRVSGRQLSGKGGDIVVTEVTREYPIPHLLRSWVTIEIARDKSSGSAEAMSSFSK